ncbi:MAG: type II toxin-antitoxin system Phd/YefM family antitoxin [Pseudonocardia sp.]
MSLEHIGVADAKRRFAELTERVRNGESFVIVNRGHPVVALVPPQRVADDAGRPPIGLVAFTGALAAEWDSVDEDMTAIVAARRQVVDRPAPTFE